MTTTNSHLTLFRIAYTTFDCGVYVFETGQIREAIL